MNDKHKPQDLKSTWRKQQKKLYEQWPATENQIHSNSDYQGNLELRDNFLRLLQKEVQSNGKDYIEIIQELEKEVKGIGTQWLQGIVDDFQSMVFKTAPAFNQD